MRKMMYFLFAVPIILGSECVPTELDLPLKTDTPEIVINLNAQVQAFESGLRDGGDNEAILTALCNCEGDPTGCVAPDEGCNPPILPDMIPREIDDPTHPGSTLNVTEWLEADAESLEKLTDVAQAVSIDVTDIIEIQSPEAVKSVTVEKISVKFSENTLSVPLPDMEAYTGSGVSSEELLDAKKLIEDEKLEKFGVLASIPGGNTDSHEMTLDEEGKATFSESLKKLDVAIAVHSVVDFPPEGTEPIVKPKGEGKLTAKLEALFTVSAEFACGG